MVVVEEEIVIVLVVGSLDATGHAGGRAYFFKERFPPRKPPPFPRKKEKIKK